MRDIHAKLMDTPKTERLALLQNLCEGDREIESEMMGLLSAHEKAGSFLHEPAAVAFNYVPSESAESELSSGTVLSDRFHILRLLNTGGMGSVYEAWDLELHEVLALKTIRPEIASERSVIERFKREVSQARQVTHPNICRVYDLFNHDFGPDHRIWFLTMQLLKGPTLLERIREKGSFTSREAFTLVKQMVAGLAAAHEHGIVHRDFKSGNVMLVQDPGHAVQAVITDFGLASHATAADDAGGVQARQGTPAYVAPEQWVDGAVAPAGDQYSLGVVMCEMLTGERPAPVLPNEASDARVLLPAGKKLDARWESAIHRCLEIRPEERFGSLDDLLAAIDPSHRRKLVIRGITSAGAVFLVTVTGLLVRSNINRLPSLTGLEQLTPGGVFSEGPRLSADGKMIAYVLDSAVGGDPDIGNLDVWVNPLPKGEAKRITTNPAMDESPSPSPDGHFVAFESSRSDPGIYLADVVHGGERPLVRDGHGPAFSPDGRYILYWTGDEYRQQPSGKIFLLNIYTGELKQLAKRMKDARNPVWNSNGQDILFSGCLDTTRPFPDCTDWWITTVDDAEPRETFAITSLASQHVFPNIYFGGWQGDAVVFSAVHEGSMGLWEIKLDQAKAKVSGIAKQVFSGDNRSFIISSSLVGNSLALCEWNPAIHVWRIEHAGDPKRVKFSKVTNVPEFDYSPSVSHNGRWLVFARGYSNNTKIYRMDAQTGIEALLPLKETSIYAPIIDDAGKTVAYEASDGKVPSVWIGSTSGMEKKLCTGCRNPTGWLSQPDAVLYSNSDLSEVRTQPVGGGPSRTILTVKDGTVQDAVWSPENQYIAFTVSKHGSDGQIYATRFLPSAASPDVHWVEITAASELTRKPRWSGDGKTILFLSKRDGFWCLWGRHFNPALGRAVGAPFDVKHFHNPQRTPAGINAAGLNVSASGDSIYLNVLETSGTIWVGKLKSNSFFSLFK